MSDPIAVTCCWSHKEIEPGITNVNVENEFRTLVETTQVYYSTDVPVCGECAGLSVNQKPTLISEVCLERKYLNFNIAVRRKILLAET